MTVTYQVDDGIARVELARPDKLNALNLAMLNDLVKCAHEARRDKSVRAVVLSGQGRSFCAGLDFADVLADSKAIAPVFTPRPWRGTNTFQEACWAYRRLPVPVIAAVQGHCLGGGLQIALGADFRVASPDSSWAVLEGKWGLIPDMSGIQSLKELVGIDVAKRLTMTAEIISGERAYELGLVTQLDDEPLVAAVEFARLLSERSPDQLAAAKRLFNRSWNSSARTTFRRERLEQLVLLAANNTKVARKAAFGKGSEKIGIAKFGPRILP